MEDRIQRHALLMNLAVNLLAMFLFHGIVMAVVSMIISVTLGDVLAFLAVLFIHHLLIMLILSHMLDFFVYTESGEALRKINTPVAITLIRITSLPNILFLIILMPRHPVLGLLIGYVAIAFISDFLDGNISRRYHQTTKIGAYLDSMSDYAVLIAISIAYIIYDLLPDWFFVVVMVRLFFQWAAAGILTIIKGGISEHRSSFLSKTSIFLIMFTYAVALLQFIPALDRQYPMISMIVEWFVAPVLVISLIEKIAIFVGDLRSGKIDHVDDGDSTNEE